MGELTHLLAPGGVIVEGGFTTCSVFGLSLWYRRLWSTRLPHVTFLVCLRGLETICLILSPKLKAIQDLRVIWSKIIWDMRARFWKKAQSLPPFSSVEINLWGISYKTLCLNACDRPGSLEIFNHSIILNSLIQRQPQQTTTHSLTCCWMAVAFLINDIASILPAALFN